MKHNTNWITVLLLLLSFSIKAQENTFQKIFELEKVNDVSIDPLYNIYVIDEKLELVKYDLNFNIINRYSDNKFSKSTVLLTENSFKTILFHPNYGEIIALDNTLSEISHLEYYTIGENDISALGASADNQSLWLFDPTLQSLIKLNQTFQVERQEDISGLGYPIFPNYIKEIMGTLYLVDPNLGIHIFDNSGNFKNNFVVPPSPSVHIGYDGVYYIEQEEIKKINFTTFEKTALKLDKAITKMAIRDNYLAVIDINKNLVFYKLP